MLSDLKSLGFQANLQKSVLLPSQQATLLGLDLYSCTMRARLSPARVQSLQTCLNQFRTGSVVHVGLCLRLSGGGGGGGPSRTPSLWSLDRATSQLAHKSFGANGSLSGSQTVFTSIGQKGCHFLVRMDNTAVVSYLNRQGGFGADLLSRQSLEGGEWRLHPLVVSLIWQRFGRVEVDLFASSMTAHCPLWFSVSPPSPLGLDTLAHEWPRTSPYAFPPIRLLPVVLFRVRSDRGERLLLVAPLWPTQTWFSDLVSLLVGPPWEVPLRHDLLTQARGMI